jgi:transposase
MNRLSSDTIEAIRHSIESGKSIRPTAYELGLSVTTVRRYVRLMHLRVRRSKGGNPLQGKCSQARITQKLLEACRQKDGTWSAEFFELIGVRPTQTMDWIEEMLLQPVDLKIYEQLAAMARGLGNDPGEPFFCDIGVVVSKSSGNVSARYELFKAENNIRIRFDDDRFTSR